MIKTYRSISLFICACLFVFALEFLLVEINAISSTNFNVSILACFCMLISLVTYLTTMREYSILELEYVRDETEKEMQRVKDETFHIHSTRKFEDAYPYYQTLNQELMQIELQITKKRKEISKRIQEEI